MTAKRRLRNVVTLFISLVDKGANQKTIIWKSDAEQQPTIEKQFAIAKTDEEKRLVYGIVYAPEEVDSHGDIMSAAEIEKTAHEFLQAKRTNNIDKQHDFVADEGYVAESWLVRKGDPLFPEEPEGAWAVAIKVTDDDTWQLIKSGYLGGLSIGGFGSAEELEKAGVPAGGTQPANGGILEKARTLLVKWFLGENVQKDFMSEYSKTTMQNAVWALSDSLAKILSDESISDKKAAVKESINQFTSFIDNLAEGTNKMANEQTKVELTEEVKQELAALSKAQDDKLAEISKQLEALSELTKTVEAISTRLEAVEKAHPGKKSAEGEDPKPQNPKQYKGFKLV